MTVRITFTEIIVPAHVIGWDNHGKPVIASGKFGAEEVQVPPDVSVFEMVGVHYDYSNIVWRVLTRRYRDEVTTDG